MTNQQVIHQLEANKVKETGKMFILFAFIFLSSFAGMAQCSTNIYTTNGNYVKLQITGLNLVVTPTGGDCTFSRAELSYDISFHDNAGNPISPIQLHNLQGNINCNGRDMYFSLPTKGGAGTANSVTSGGHPFVNGNCAAYNQSFCTNITFTIAGNGIASQNFNCNPNIPIPTPLPVALIDFETTLEDNRVTLIWTTAQEENNSHFEILKSENGEKWEKIGVVEGAGNSYENNTYSFTDYAPSQVNYYKLVQVDFDGTEHSLGYKFIIASLSSALSSPQIYPNPVTDVLNIYIPSIGQQNVTIEITDMSGRTQLNTELALPQNQTLHIATNQLTAGMYLLKVVSKEKTFTERIIKQ